MGLLHKFRTLLQCDPEARGGVITLIPCVPRYAPKPRRNHLRVCRHTHLDTQQRHLRMTRFFVFFSRTGNGGVCVVVNVGVFQGNFPVVLLLLGDGKKREGHGRSRTVPYIVQCSSL